MYYPLYYLAPLITTCVAACLLPCFRLSCSCPLLCTFQFALVAAAQRLLRRSSIPYQNNRPFIIKRTLVGVNLVKYLIRIKESIDIYSYHERHRHKTDEYVQRISTFDVDFFDHISETSLSINFSIDKGAVSELACCAGSSQMTWHLPRCYAWKVRWTAPK